MLGLLRPDVALGWVLAARARPHAAQADERIISLNIPASVASLRLRLGDPADTSCPISELHPQSELRGHGVDKGDAIVAVGGARIGSATHTKRDVAELLRKRPVVIVVRKSGKQPE